MRGVRKRQCKRIIEHRGRFIERDAMLANIVARLCRVPFESHGPATPSTERSTRYSHGVAQLWMRKPTSIAGEVRRRPADSSRSMLIVGQVLQHVRGAVGTIEHRVLAVER